MDFSDALRFMKNGCFMRRQAWKPDKYVTIRTSDALSMSYLELRYYDGRRAPWTPTRCDLLESDWVMT